VADHGVGQVQVPPDHEDGRLGGHADSGLGLSA
jgi:hypothetical protein